MRKREVKKFLTKEYATSCKNASDNNLSSLLFTLSYANISDLKFNSVLDIGSQEGQFASFVSKKSLVTDVSCIDISSFAVDGGRKRFPQFNWHCCDFNDFSVNRNYDLILALNWFFYYSKAEREEALSKIKSLLSKNGSFMIKSNYRFFTKSGSGNAALRTKRRRDSVLKRSWIETLDD